MKPAEMGKLWCCRKKLRKAGELRTQVKWVFHRKRSNQQNQMLSTRGSGSTEDPNNPGENSCVGTEKMKAWLGSRVIEENEEVKTANPNNGIRSLAMKSSYNGGEFGWIEVWDEIYHTVVLMGMISAEVESDNAGRTGHDCQSKILEEARQLVEFLWCRAQWRSCPIWAQRLLEWCNSGKIEADRTRCRKIRQTSTLLLFSQWIY